MYIFPRTSKRSLVSIGISTSHVALIWFWNAEELNISTREDTDTDEYGDDQASVEAELNIGGSKSAQLGYRIRMGKT